MCLVVRRLASHELYVAELAHRHHDAAAQGQWRVRSECEVTGGLALGPVGNIVAPQVQRGQPRKTRSIGGYGGHSG